MTRHRHYCCHCDDAFFVCRQDADHCRINYWECPRCIDQALDDYYVTKLNTTNTTRHAQELTRHER